jgi:hypothetical protein
MRSLRKRLLNSIRSHVLPPRHERSSGNDDAWIRVAPPTKEAEMTFGKGALLWLIGIPLPIILLLALFWR